MNNENAFILTIGISHLTIRMYKKDYLLHKHRVKKALENQGRKD